MTIIIGNFAFKYNDHASEQIKLIENIIDKLCLKNNQNINSNCKFSIHQNLILMLPIWRHN